MVFQAPFLCYFSLFSAGRFLPPWNHLLFAVRFPIFLRTFLTQRFGCESFRRQNLTAFTFYSGVYATTLYSTCLRRYRSIFYDSFSLGILRESVYPQQASAQRFLESLTNFPQHSCLSSFYYHLFRVLTQLWSQSLACLPSQICCEADNRQWSPNCVCCCSSTG